MKKFIASVAIVLSAVSVSACGSNASDPRPTKTVTAAPTPSQKADEGGQTSGDAGLTDKDNLFVGVIKKNTNDFDNFSSTALVNLGHVVCEQWDAGRTLSDVATDFINKGFTPEDSGFLTGGATAAYCPKYLPELKKQSDQLQGNSSDTTA